jgi:hypothetical protein
MYDSPTVEEELVYAGVRVGADGKLYSSTGKEIIVRHVTTPGAQLPPFTLTPAAQEEAERQKREFDRQYLVISIVHLGC